VAIRIAIHEHIPAPQRTFSVLSVPSRSGTGILRDSPGGGGGESLRELKKSWVKTMEKEEECTT